MHTDYLKPIFNYQTESKYSEWQIREAWDDMLAENTISGTIDFASNSCAFRAFFERLDKIVERDKKRGKK